MGLFDKKPIAEEQQIDERAKLRGEISGVLERTKQKLAEEAAAPPTVEEEVEQKQIMSREYSEFKKEYLPKQFTFYEKMCNTAEKIVKISPPKEKLAELQKNIEICHLNATPTGVYTFAFLGPTAIALVGALLGFLLLDSPFFIFFFFICGYLMVKPLQTLPTFFANSWRMKASNQMVLCIFYIVTYMRHTSNLERAIGFATEHLTPPLSLDLRKILWDVETQKYESVKEALDAYLETWKDSAQEFIESMHLIEASLYEGDETKRVGTLDRALSTMLEGTYEKMLHYAQELKSPITMLHMMGVILPILGLVILPLVVSFMSQVKWYHLVALYNIALPLGVYYMSRKILSTRPTGYGDTDISDNPEVKKFKKMIFHFGKKEVSIEPMYVAVIFAVFFLLLGLSPLLIHAAVYNPVEKNNHWDFVITNDWNLASTTKMEDKNAKIALLDYRLSQPKPDSPGGEIIGPYGLGATLLSMFIIVGIGISMGLYFKLRSKNVIQIREKSRQLEQEFASALFQLGNRIGDGIPVEIAFAKVAETMQGTVSGEFFAAVSNNISQKGMGVEDAIFHPQYGALVAYPSDVIESSMKVLTESAKKGPKIAASALINVSNYMKEIHKVNERLKDLLSDIVSSMRSQISFMAPVISGIVIGITSMITTILGKLGAQMRTLAETGGGGAGGLLSLFGDSVPTYYFQFMVGLYVVQIVYILTIMTNGVENGADELNERYMLGSNLVTSTLTYIVIATVVTVLFNILAVTILKGIAQ
ncbi:MAG: hypothetical protein Q7R76_05610 [Candidatus Woesearchaeota archaeon]|nr:hypothetical protein [Candidatus Woesearchaeota archaeon]